MKRVFLRSFKKRMSIMLSMVLILGIFLQAPFITAKAASIDISTYWGTGAVTHAYTISSSGTIDLTQLTGVDAGGLTLTVDSGAEVDFTGAANTEYTNLSIVISGGATVTLDNVSINNSTLSAQPVVASDDNTGNTLKFKGTNTLTAPNGRAAIHVGRYYVAPDTKSANLAINGDNTGVLNAIGHGSGAGIGGDSSSSSTNGTITITGGTVNATGGYYGAGIGSGGSPDVGGRTNNGTITITGGTVNATGGNYGAGIGGGYLDTGGTITITGGKVNTTGSNQSAGIGGGYYSSCRGTVTITGGTVNAAGGTGGFGIGIGGSVYDSGFCLGTITITGGTVNAAAGTGGYGIGSSSLVGTFYFSGGSIKALSVLGTPKNNSVGNTPVYLTTLTLPSGTNVTGLTVKQNGSNYTYGSAGMQADSNRKLCLYLPENTLPTDTTTADITADGTSYNGYYGTVNNSETSVLKMDQALLSVTGINTSYIYGDTISPSVSGGSGTGAVTYNYNSGATNLGSVQPTALGNYTVTANKAADDSYYEAAAASSVGFSIVQKDISSCTVADIAAHIYTGGQIKPSVTVTDGAKTLVKDSDYTVTFGANINTGTAAGSVTITGNGNYTGAVTKTFSIVNPPSLNFTITASAGPGGRISPSGSVSIASGGSQAFIVAANDGYEIKDVLADGVSVGAVTSYTFSNVTANHTISAEFSKKTISNPFADVSQSDWYYDAVSYVSQKGLMTGTDAQSFDPNGDMTRAMIVTVLLRLSGDSGSYQNTFNDVASGAWYEKAAAWAAKNGIASGLGNSSFAPDNKLSREQLAVMLYNYAKYKGLNITAANSGVLDGYADAGNVSSWASDAVKWAVSVGLISGDGKNINPQDNATRAQIAVMLQRFIEKVIADKQ